MIDIVVLNRNLRLHDNAALYYGSLNSNYIVIHLYDENYWEANGRSARQLKFSYDCLQELDDNLKKIGSEVNIFEGSFDDLKKWIKINVNDCFIHINHCTDIDYFRKGFEKFKQEFGDGLKVYDDFGLQLNNFDRDTWSKNWNHVMHSSLIDAPKINKNSAETNLIKFNEHNNKIKSKPIVKIIGLPEFDKEGIRISDWVNQALDNVISSKNKSGNLESKIKNAVIRQIREVWGKKPKVEIIFH